MNEDVSPIENGDLFDCHLSFQGGNSWGAYLSFNILQDDARLKKSASTPPWFQTTASEVSIGRGPSEDRQVKAADITRNRFQVEQQLYTVVTSPGCLIVVTSMMVNLM